MELSELEVCRPTKWCKPSCGDCNHCHRLLYGRTTIDGKVKKQKTGFINYRQQRRRLMRLYRGTYVEKGLLNMEVRVVKSLGFRL